MSSDPQQQAAAAAATTTSAGPSILDQVIKATRPQDQAKAEKLGEMKHYGLHRHFTGSGSVLMFGGGIKRGFLYGETAPERPLVTVKNPISIRDLHATIFTAMGISPKTAFEIEKRPFYATEDGKGRPANELFARPA